MRVVKNPQLCFDEVNINPRSHDDIPAVLKGLPYIYVTDEVREKVFDALKKTLDPKINTSVERPSMELWKVFVLATLKLGLNCDFDRLQALANKHNSLRQILGHADWPDTTTYKLQALIDNVSKLKTAVRRISIK